MVYIQRIQPDSAIPVLAISFERQRILLWLECKHNSFSFCALWSLSLSLCGSGRAISCIRTFVRQIVFSFG